MLPVLLRMTARRYEISRLLLDTVIRHSRFKDSNRKPWNFDLHLAEAMHKIVAFFSRYKYKQCELFPFILLSIVALQVRPYLGWTLWTHIPIYMARFIRLFH